MHDGPTMTTTIEQLFPEPSGPCPLTITTTFADYCDDNWADLDGEERGWWIVHLGAVHAAHVTLETLPCGDREGARARLDAGGPYDFEDLAAAMRWAIYCEPDRR